LPGRNDSRAESSAIRALRKRLPRTAPQWLRRIQFKPYTYSKRRGRVPTGRRGTLSHHVPSERFPTRACALAYIWDRRSPLSGSPRLAVNPPNAILNYLYAVLESEARLAAAALGLDPGLGVLHKDTPNRDSLACDLMEPVRPQVDAFLLDWISRGPLRREWFFEQRDGNCRLMGTFAARLSETAPSWARAIAPIAEWVARTLSTTISGPAGRHGPATRLTQRHKREAKGSGPLPRPNLSPAPGCLSDLWGTSQVRYGLLCFVRSYGIPRSPH